MPGDGCCTFTVTGLVGATGPVWAVAKPAEVTTASCAAKPRRRNMYFAMTGRPSLAEAETMYFGPPAGCARASV